MRFSPESRQTGTQGFRISAHAELATHVVRDFFLENRVKNLGFERSCIHFALAQFLARAKIQDQLLRVINEYLVIKIKINNYKS